MCGVALDDDHPDIRITGIRMARQLGLTPSLACKTAAHDSEPAVRRELAVALRYDDSPQMPGVWATLAIAHDGEDRWYLEALGLASDLRPAECFDAWLRTGGNWDTKPGKDIVWRVRASKAAGALMQVISEPRLSLEDAGRYFRSFEYHSQESKLAAVEMLLRSRSDDPRGDAILVRTVERVPGFDYSAQPAIRTAIKRHMDRSEGSPDYLKMLKRFRPDGLTEKWCEWC